MSPEKERYSTQLAVGTDLGIVQRLQSYVLRHLQVFFSSLGRISRAPFSTLLTAAVLGIALALPTGLHLILKNLQQVSSGWDGSAQISLFLKLEVSENQAIDLSRRLKLRAKIGEVNLITRAEALNEFKTLSGFGDALKALDHNPLPHVLVITPALSDAGPAATEALLLEMRQLKEVDLAQLDMQWVKRLYAIMEIAQRGVVVVATLLALAVLLIIGNTIRLEIQNRRDEIVIIKLVGATDAFIRRPFLYNGVWYGLLGGFIAWLLISTALGMLSTPVQNLAGLYHSGFVLQGLSFGDAITLFLVSALLGLSGSWLSVGRHLGSIEPE